MPAGSLASGASWAATEQVVSECRDFAETLSKAVEELVTRDLGTKLTALDSIAYGGQDNEAWSTAYDEAPSDATWAESLQVLWKMNVARLDEAMLACDVAVRRATTAKECFMFGDGLAELFKAAVKVSNSARCSKIEGTVMHIINAVDGNAASKRTQIERQKKLLKKYHI